MQKLTPKNWLEMETNIEDLECASISPTFPRGVLFGHARTRAIRRVYRPDGSINNLRALRMPFRRRRTFKALSPLLWPSVSRHFVSSRRLTPDSVKTYGNPARTTAWRKTYWLSCGQRAFALAPSASLVVDHEIATVPIPQAYRVSCNFVKSKYPKYSRRRGTESHAPGQGHLALCRNRSRSSHSQPILRRRHNRVGA